MKKLILLVTALCISTAAFAFGGGHSGKSSSYYRKEKGVSSLGLHVDPNNPIVPPEFRDCGDDETAVVGKCCPNYLVYTEGENQKCCDLENHVIRDNACVDGTTLVGTGRASYWLEDDYKIVFTWDYVDQMGDTVSGRGAGSWRLVYDGEDDTYKVTDYYRDTKGDLKTIEWYANSLEEIESTPMKQGSDHAFLNKLKEVFGIKNALAGGNRDGTDSDEWNEVKTAKECAKLKRQWNKKAQKCCPKNAKIDNGECYCPQYVPELMHDETVGEICCPGNARVKDGDCECIAKNAQVYGGKCECSHPNKNLMDDGNGGQICCPGNARVKDGECECPEHARVSTFAGSCECWGTELYMVPDGNGWYACCPDGVAAANGACCPTDKPMSVKYGRKSACCPPGVVSLDKDGNCCPAGVNVIDGQCCPADKPVVVKNYSDDEVCCPTGTLGVDENGNCCPPGVEDYVTDADAYECCTPEKPHGSYDGELRKWGCCAWGEVFKNGECVKVCDEKERNVGDECECDESRHFLKNDAGDCVCEDGYEENDAGECVKNDTCVAPLVWNSEKQGCFCPEDGLYYVDGMNYRHCCKDGKDWYQGSYWWNPTYECCAVINKLAVFKAGVTGMEMMCCEEGTASAIKVNGVWTCCTAEKPYGRQKSDGTWTCCEGMKIDKHDNCCEGLDANGECCPWGVESGKW
ncbi:MAG: hypothetical protein II942_04360 [Alphaproteobacteria bacterium]|nr:hypothetical protein [Alphaproteobacteria bacterium]